MSNVEVSKPEAAGKPSEPANRKIPANLLLTPEESGDKVTERMYMHRIKEPLCKRINLSGGLSCNQVTLYIILSLSDKKKKCDSAALLKNPRVVNVCESVNILSLDPQKA